MSYIPIAAATKGILSTTAETNPILQSSLRWQWYDSSK